jgi:ribosome-associated protein
MEVTDENERLRPAPERTERGVHAGRVWIPWNELSFHFARGGGPGGQNVNKVETRVEVRWNIEDSTSLSATQRSRLRAALGRRISAEGTLAVRSGAERTQERNRRAALDRLANLVTEALRPRKTRRATKPTQASREKRLQEKRARSERKLRRRTPPEE